MPAIEVGRLCLKLTGRESGKRCVVLDLMDKSFVLITGPKDLTGVKRRRTNMSHLLPLEEKVDIKRGASDEEVTEALKTAGKLTQKVPAKHPSKRKAKQESE